jgi:hypothetical protein
MAKFSERYGYVSPSSVLIRESLTDEIINAICTAYDLLRLNMDSGSYTSYTQIEKYLWCYFLNNRLRDFSSNNEVATKYIKSKNEWYQKLDLVEETLSYLAQERDEYRWYDNPYKNHHKYFVRYLNEEFVRLNFAYRVIDNQIVEVTSEDEVATIEAALHNSTNAVKEHLRTALKSLSKRPDGDYRNSIKESISAVEAIVREITGEKALDFKKLESKGIVLPPVLKKSFESLYGYTNDKSTGIRHALMDDTNAPTSDEATFMLVSCSAFINYLTKKKK